jgi:replication fork protection complex subunit Csm3/Swi3
VRDSRLKPSDGGRVLSQLVTMREGHASVTPRVSIHDLITMSVSLDDIWDVPATALSVSRPSTSDVDIDDGVDELMPPSARKQPAQKLFLDSDSDDEGAAAVPGASHAPRTPARSVAPPIDHLFNNLDDDVEDNNGRPPPLTPHAILPSSSPPREGDDRAGKKEDKGKDGGDEKKRKPLPKLDETRLLGPDGFEALLAQMKGFKPKGKGHEVRIILYKMCVYAEFFFFKKKQEDLNRLLQQYQFWAHKLYPKTHFRDTVKTVEKLCHSKRMHVSGCLRLLAKQIEQSIIGGAKRIAR